MSKTSHIYYVPNKGTVCCYHCGDEYRCTPCSLKMLEVILRQYRKEHLRCAESERGSVLRASNERAFDALPEDKKQTFGMLDLPPGASLGDKIAHEMEMQLLRDCLNGKVPPELAQNEKFMKNIAKMRELGLSIEDIPASTGGTK